MKPTPLPSEKKSRYNVFRFLKNRLSRLGKPRISTLPTVTSPTETSPTATSPTETSPKCGNPYCNLVPCLDIETGILEPYCSSRCADLSKSIPRCSRNGCNAHRYISPQNPTQYRDYCNPECLWKEASSLEETKLTLLDDANNLDFRDVAVMFSPISYRILAIFRIQYPPAITKIYLDYCQHFRKNAKVINAVAMTVQRFHGTRRMAFSCDALNQLAKGKTVFKFCSYGCGLCGIIQRSLHAGSDGRYLAT